MNIKYKALKRRIEKLDSHEISNYESLLEEIVECMLRYQRFYRSHINDDSDVDISHLKKYIRMLDELFDDFKTILDYIKQEFWKSCVSKDVEKFNELIHLKYEKMLLDVNRIKKNYVCVYLDYCSIN